MESFDSSERVGNRRSTSKMFTLFALVLAFVVLIGCDKQQDANDFVKSETYTDNSARSEVDANNSVRSEVVVRQYLKDLGIKIGTDKERERIVEVKSSGFTLQGNAPKEELLELNAVEDCGFQYDAKDDRQTIRFKTMWRAYAGGLARMSNLTGGEIKEKKFELTQELSQTLSAEFKGVTTIVSAESFDAAGSEYEGTVAVSQSKKREEMYSGLQSKPGKHSLGDFVEKESSTGIVCPKSYCDNEGVWWRIAGVPVELDGNHSPKGGTAAIEAAKRYAYEAAMRTIAVRVSVKTQLQSTMTKSGDGVSVEDKLSKVVRVEPLDTILPVDPSKTKWIELERVDPMTGAPVRCVIAALYSGGGGSVTKSALGQDTKEM